MNPPHPVRPPHSSTSLCATPPPHPRMEDALLRRLTRKYHPTLALDGNPPTHTHMHQQRARPPTHFLSANSAPNAPTPPFPCSLNIPHPPIPGPGRT